MLLLEYTEMKLFKIQKYYKNYKKKVSMNATLCPKVVSVQFKTAKTCTRKKVYIRT